MFKSQYKMLKDIDPDSLRMPPLLKKPKKEKEYAKYQTYWRDGDHFYRCLACKYTGGIEDILDRPQCRGCRKWFGPKPKVEKMSKGILGYAGRGAVRLAAKVLPSKHLIRAGSFGQKLGTEMAQGGRIARSLGPSIKTLGTEVRLGGLNSARRVGRLPKSKLVSKPMTYLEAEARRYSRDAGNGGMLKLPAMLNMFNRFSKPDYTLPVIVGTGGLVSLGTSLMNRKKDLLESKLRHKEKMERMRMKGKVGKNLEKELDDVIRKKVLDIPGKLLARGAIDYASRKGALGVPGRALGRSLMRGAISQTRSSARTLLSQPGRSFGITMRRAAGKLSGKGYKKTAQALANIGRASYKNPRTALGIGLAGAYGGKKLVEREGVDKMSKSAKFQTSCPIAKRLIANIARRGASVLGSKLSGLASKYRPELKRAGLIAGAGGAGYLYGRRKGKQKAMMMQQMQDYEAAELGKILKNLASAADVGRKTFIAGVRAAMKAKNPAKKALADRWKTMGRTLVSRAAKTAGGGVNEGADSVSTVRGKRGVVRRGRRRL